ncbi:MAG: PHP domain-containing protein [Lentisphaerota bacterium]
MIDLHAHSTFSDGSLTPEELIDLAVANGLTAVALTDHDSTKGLPLFLKAAEELPVRAVPGVEISADFSPGTMHMLGYFIRYDEADLNQHLAWIRNGREMRNAEILHKLNALGCHITWEEVACHAGEDVVGRPHFAQAMIAKKFVSGKDEAFDRYLGRGKPAYAERRRLSPAASVKLIRDAGGVPVLAHPFTLKLDSRELKKTLIELRSAGLEGLEVIYSEHTADMQREYLGMAKDLNLVATGGSDFHGAMSPDIKLGTGFGGLRIPDDIVPQLEARRPS